MYSCKSKNVNIWGGDFILEISDGTFQNIFPAKKLSAERHETLNSEISLDLEWADKKDH